MAKRIITLYIDDNGLKVLVTNGEHIKEWAYLPLDRELVKNNVVVDQPGLASRIKLMLKTLGISGKTVCVGLSGLHCLNRVITLPQLPKEMLDEAIRREAKRVLPVPLEQLYLSWQRLPTSEGQTKIFLVALPSVTVDALVETLHQAGLKISFMGIKPLLLARMVSEPTAIIVDVQLTEFDVAILVNGVPQAMRTVPFPDEGLSAEKKQEIIRNELERTISFHNTNNPEDALMMEAPIFVSGQLTDDVDLCKIISDTTRRTVLPIQSTLSKPTGFDPGPYLPNIGLVSHQVHKTPKAGSSLVTLNSLPLIYQSKQVSLINISVLPGAVVTVALIVILIMVNQSASADINSISAKLSAAEQSLRESVASKQDLSGHIKELENNLQQVATSYKNYLSVLEGLKEQRARTNEDLSAVMNGLPKAITLGSIKHTGATLEISGQAGGEDDVLAYLMQLDSSNLFGEIAVTRMAKSEGGGVGFTLLVNRERPGDEISGIKIALRYLPADVSLVSFTQSRDTITLNGWSPDEDSIVLFLKQLEDSGLFREIALSGKTANTEGGIDFTVFLRM